MVGEVVAGRYALAELVGSGGMSSVYRAHDRQLERDVALKILHDSQLDDGEALERFQREARAVARLSHPNVVTVIDRGEEDGSPYIVFEYVPGETLKDCVARRGPLPVDEALSIAADVGRALAFAHEHGIVHRDVKPQNVLLDPDGRPKVTDFGIARRVDVDKGITQTGTVIGTSDYIAPEQARGGQATAASDVYGLACVLFELLTGSPPFTGQGFFDVATKHVHEPAPNLLDRRPDAPLRVAAALDRALAKDPDDRFASMDDFVAELDACREQPTLIGAPPVPRVRLRRGAAGRSSLALFAIGGALLVAVAVILVLRDGGTPGTEAAGQPVELSAVASYDPEGDDGEEHPREVPFATDGDPGTYWPTSTYHDEFTLIKPGVGIVVDSGRAASLSELVVATDMPGFTAEVRAGQAASGPFDEVVSPAQTVGARTVFPIDDAEFRYWLVWITDLDGRARITEITAE